jgi:hypothetical protein
VSVDDQVGMATVQLVTATALSLVVFVMLTNLVVDLYVRGVVRSAVDEGARAGAPVDLGATDCVDRARDVLAHLVPGPVGRSVRVECREEQGTMRASADAVLRGWLPGLVPDWSFRVVGSATKERSP